MSASACLHHLHALQSAAVAAAVAESGVTLAQTTSKPSCHTAVLTASDLLRWACSARHFEGRQVVLPLEISAGATVPGACSRAQIGE